MKEHWKVGEVAELAGLTIRTLRYYDQICLFSPSQYTESGHRLYTKADLVRLQPILSLKQMGMSLEEIQLLLSNPEEQTVAEILQTQISRVKKRDRGSAKTSSRAGKCVIGCAQQSDHVDSRTY
ncbi:MerR family transcriptional regulator [Planococcus glaciei]|nr:MerR family transcriptional regulator [Planococcus glaciei]QDY46612.1 MerR family transcriptional regulator [Planococcus glaciei]